MPTRVSAFVALFVALAAVAGTAWGLSALRSQERASSDAEKRLVSLRLETSQLLDIPWGASPGETDDPQAVRDELVGAEDVVLDEINDLAHSPGLPERGDFLAHFEPAVDALEQILEAVASEDDAALGAAPNVSARQMYKADSVLQRAAERYRRDAERSATREAVGSAALVGFLFVAFAVYFVRSTRTRDRITRVAAELEVARDSALAASRAKSTFLANMSHEIRTPLTTVLASAEMLDDTPLDGTQLRLLDKMRRANGQLKGLVEEVLDFSRVEAGQVRLVSERFDLHDWVGDVADAYAARADQGSVRFAWHVDPDVPRTVIGDKVRLLQIVGNLLDNAFKFTAEGQVTFAVRPLPRAGNGMPATPGLDRSEGVEFVVADTGIGIPEDHLTSVFESFQQVDGSITRPFGGSGLGLAICKDLTELMNGTVTVSSQVDAGSTFVVRVPLAHDRPEAPANATTSADEARSRGQQHSWSVDGPPRGGSDQASVFLR